MHIAGPCWAPEDTVRSMCTCYDASILVCVFVCVFVSDFTQSRFHPTADFTSSQSLLYCRFQSVPDFTKPQILLHPRFHPAADFTPLQISSRRRFLATPDFTLRQMSPRPRFHPVADCTHLQIAPRARFHPTLDVTIPHVLPRPRFHPARDSMGTQVPHPARLVVFPDQPSVQIQRHTRATARPDPPLSQIPPPRKRSRFGSVWSRGESRGGVNLEVFSRKGGWIWGGFSGKVVNLGGGESGGGRGIWTVGGAWFRSSLHKIPIKLVYNLSLISVFCGERVNLEKG